MRGGERQELEANPGWAEAIYGCSSFFFSDMRFFLAASISQKGSTLTAELQRGTGGEGRRKRNRIWVRCVPQCLPFSPPDTTPVSWAGVIKRRARVKCMVNCGRQGSTAERSITINTRLDQTTLPYSVAGPPINGLPLQFPLCTFLPSNELFCLFQRFALTSTGWLDSPYGLIALLASTQSSI